jgi:hypothetical protein
MIASCSIRQVLLGVTAAVALFVTAAVSDAAPYEFGQFNIVNANQPFSFTNSGGISAAVNMVNVPTTFNFTVQTGLSTADHAAFLNLAPVGGPSITPAATAGSLVSQPIGMERLTITSGADGTGTNYLTLLFTGDITGLLGASNLDFTGDDNNPNAIRIVTYTSDFGTFGAAGTGNGFNLALATVAPAVSIGPGGFLSSFNANVDGQFTSNFTANVPEPATVALLVFGLAIVAGATRRRLG